MDRSFWRTDDGLFNRNPLTGVWLVEKNWADIDFDVLPRSVCICGRPITFVPANTGYAGGWMHDYNTDDDPYPCYATPIH